MTILSELYASNGPEVILPTIELQCAAWEDEIVLVADNNDHTITTEDQRTLTALATGMNVALPKRDATGAQSLVFAIDNVRSQAAARVRSAVRQQETVRLIYREYLNTDLSAPANEPLRFNVKSYRAREEHVEVTAVLFDLIDMRWPRDLYTSENAPGLKYL